MSKAPSSAPDKRTRLLRTAVSLTYRKGFRQTTLADIAAEAQVPLGNVYYYFQTKNQIGEAILEQRLAGFEAQRDKWERVTPRERLYAFIQMTVDNRDLLASGGCPMGTLTSELRKEQDALAKKASALLAAPLTWLEAQFNELGRQKDSRGLALHLLSALQGVSLLAHSLDDASLVLQEAKRLKEWIRTL